MWTRWVGNQQERKVPGIDNSRAINTLTGGTGERAGATGERAGATSRAAVTYAVRDTNRRWGQTGTKVEYQALFQLPPISLFTGVCHTLHPTKILMQDTCR